jgi:dimethylglycine dehydrogenase
VPGFFVLDGGRIGRATAGVNRHHVMQARALGYATPEAAQVGTALEIEIRNKRYTARVIEESPYDPENTRLRA